MNVGLISYAAGLLGILTVLFVAPLVLGAFVPCQRAPLMPLRGYFGSIFLIFLIIMALGVITSLANISEYMHWSALALQP
jgi:hypothetical protein